MKKFLKTCLFAGVFASQAVTSFGTSAMNQGSGLYDELSSAVEEKEKNSQSEAVKNEETNEKKVGDNVSNSNNSTNNNAATGTEVINYKSNDISNQYVYVDNNPPISVGHAMYRVMVPVRFIGDVFYYAGNYVVPGRVKEIVTNGFSVPFTIYSIKRVADIGYANSDIQRFLNCVVIGPYKKTKDFFAYFIDPDSLDDRYWKCTKLYFYNKNLDSKKVDKLGNSVAGSAVKDEIWYTGGMVVESFKGIFRGVGRFFNTAAYALNNTSDAKLEDGSKNASPRPGFKVGKVSPSARPFAGEDDAIYE